MGEGTFDNAKGEAKEASGDVTDDKDLEREGRRIRPPARSRMLKPTPVVGTCPWRDTTPHATGSGSTN
jgi:hypothetical protein